MSTTQEQTGWLASDELESARERLPIVYVDAVPVRIDDLGQVVSVGLLLRARPDGTISRAVVSGRVQYGERIRDALLRHLEKDLGSVALPRLPVSPSPFTVIEYFPSPDVSGLHDPRQHAVSLGFCGARCRRLQAVAERTRSGLDVTRGSRQRRGHLRDDRWTRPSRATCARSLWHVAVTGLRSIALACSACVLAMPGSCCKRQVHRLSRRCRRPRRLPWLLCHHCASIG